MNLHTLIFFVTSRCNAKCETCFYWRELNQKGDLSFSEIDRLTATMPRFHELWLSGGEPLMRRRLNEILRLFYDRNGIRTLNLPTNGLFEARTLELMEFVTQELPELDVNLNFALDGFAATHDRIRGVPGNYEKTLSAIRALYPIRTRNPRVRIHVNSVVTADNLEELEPLARWLAGHEDLNGHYFQVIRGDAKNPALKNLDREAVARFYRSVQPIHEHYGQKLARRHGGGVKGWLKQHYYTETIYFHYTVQHDNFEGPSPWPMPCRAGQTILVLDYNGDIRACELRPSVANVREAGCDFGRVFPSQLFKEEADRIRQDQCWCTHVCFIHDSIKSSRKALYYDIPLGPKVV